MRFFLILTLFLTGCATKRMVTTITVLDTGIDYSHPMFKNSVIIEDESKQNLIEENGNLTDLIGHGTHVSGIVVGYAKEPVKILPLKINSRNVKVKTGIQSTHSGGAMSESLGLMESVKWAIKYKSKVINISQATSFLSKEMLNAVSLASKNDIVIVAGVANQGFNFDEHSDYRPEEHGPFPCVLRYTHNLDNIVCVGGYNDEDGLKPAYSNSGRVVDVFAKGVGVYSSLPDGKFGYRNGTSMATPKISAYISDLQVKNPSLGYKEILDLFYKSLPVSLDLKAVSRTGAYLPEPKRSKFLTGGR